MEESELANFNLKCHDVGYLTTASLKKYELNPTAFSAALVEINKPTWFVPVFCFRLLQDSFGVCVLN